MGFCSRVGCQHISSDYSKDHGYICMKCKAELDRIITDVLSEYPTADINVIIATYMRTPKLINSPRYDDSPLIKHFGDD